MGNKVFVPLLIECHAFYFMKLEGSCSGVHKPQVNKFCKVIFSIFFGEFSLHSSHVKMCISSHWAESTTWQVTHHSEIMGLQCGTYLCDCPWHLEFEGGSWIFGQYVDVWFHKTVSCHLCCCVMYSIICTEENLYCGVCSFKPRSFLSRFPCAVLIRQYPLSLGPNLCCYVSRWSAEWPLKCCNFNTWSLSLEVGTLIMFGKGIHLIKILIVVEVDTHIYIYIT